MSPGDRVRHHHPDGHTEDGRLLQFKQEEGKTVNGWFRVQWALVQFRGRRRAYCYPKHLEVLK